MLFACKIHTFAFLHSMNTKYVPCIFPNVLHCCNPSFPGGPSSKESSC